jgi:hypothetical protein
MCCYFIDNLSYVHITNNDALVTGILNLKHGSESQLELLYDWRFTGAKPPEIHDQGFFFN